MATRAIEPPTLTRTQERAEDRPPALAATAAGGRARPQGRGIVLVGERTPDVRPRCVCLGSSAVGPSWEARPVTRHRRGCGPPSPRRRPRRLRLRYSVAQRFALTWAGITTVRRSTQGSTELGSGVEVSTAAPSLGRAPLPAFGQYVDYPESERDEADTKECAADRFVMRAPRATLSHRDRRPARRGPAGCARCPTCPRRRYRPCARGAVPPAAERSRRPLGVRPARPVRATSSATVATRSAASR